jgi:hypothetical protein
MVPIVSVTSIAIIWISSLLLFKAKREFSVAGIIIGVTLFILGICIGLVSPLHMVVDGKFNVQSRNISILFYWAQFLEYAGILLASVSYCLFAMKYSGKTQQNGQQKNKGMGERGCTPTFDTEDVSP